VNRATRGALALLLAGCAAAVGFLEGGALADGRFAPKGWFEARRSRAATPGAPAGVTQPPASIRELFAALGEVEFPPSENDRSVPWRGLLAALANLCADHGFPIDFTDEPRTLERCVALGAPADVAALLDLWSEVAQRADSAIVRDTATRIAARVDADPFRARVRAALLAGDQNLIRDLGVEADSAELDARSAALLGAALLRTGAVDDALNRWREGALEHPDDPVLHLLLGWQLGGEGRERGESNESRRHLAAAAALLPDSEALRRRVAVPR
jgi:hypothetical protein